ncbi:AI-2E family transporter [Candidatus Halocynthiibacter alkanivorans]|uniref:AI-2E family transporter n=1 Tax=Candidatus Halocynthiibacter alkanivorans TaxID=2267619 RepID=UPI000DF4A288|nr:AI-2E family transporter [Candidatus Halocynthiibacter alkanivorans]
MALPVQQQAKYWGISAAALFAFLYLLGDVILPFVVGAALAYCLDPIADRLETWGLSRAISTVAITLTASVLFVLIALLILPTLVSQAVGLVETAPRLITNLQDNLTNRFPELLDENSQIYQSVMAVAETLRSKGGVLLQTALGQAASLINVLVLIILVPVITFYLLLDWDRMVAVVDRLLPRDHAPLIRQVAGDIDRTLAAFIRGQGTVCLVLGSFYATALMLVGLQFGLIVGALAGLISFIPYIGALVGGVLAIGLAVFQFWGEWSWIAAVAGIFAIGQFLEGNILTPKLVGQSVGLHPVWLIFALSAFGTMFGFVGMLVAVPVAASIGVVMRFALGQYQEGRLYKGEDHATPVTHVPTASATEADCDDE